MQTQETGQVEYHVDCWVNGSNPTWKGGGYTITDSLGKVIEQTEIKASITEKKMFTNNEGESRGIIRVLEICQNNSTIVTDSQIAMWWIRKGSAKARPDLDAMLAYGKRLLYGKACKIEWRPRDYNLAGNINEFGHVENTKNQRSHKVLRRNNRSKGNSRTWFHRTRRSTKRDSR